MTTLSSLNLATSVALTPLTDSATSTLRVNPADAQSEATVSPSTVVTIPSAINIVALETYTPNGTLASSTPTFSSASNSGDAVSRKMLGDFATATMAGQFAGLGSTLLDRFNTTGSDYSQSLSLTSTGTLSGLASPSHGPTGQVGLTIRTTSGVTVDVELGNQDGSLSVSVKSSGTLSASERQAVAKLSGGFQKAIDGLGSVPPTLDLSGLTQFDTSVLASVNFQYGVTGSGDADVSASYSQDSAARSLSVTSTAGTMSLSVDTSNPALWGTSAQRAASVASYLKQFDQANARGHGDAALMSMFDDGFTQMNENYGTASGQALPGTEGLPWLQQTDQALLTGLGDFSASIRDAARSPNPMRPREVDSFSYQVSQSTDLEGSLQDGRISQHQHAQLSASYHRTLSGSGTPVLTSSMSSQNYDYVRIDDTLDSTVAIETKRGVLLNASLSRSIDQNTRNTKYEAGVQISDVTTPDATQQSADLLALLEPLIEKGDAASDTPAWKEALSRAHEAILLTGSN